jgi:polar amino acid transport system substrate-binding protein
MTLPTPSPAAIDALAPTGTLRAAINVGNFLLVTGRGSDGNPEGVSPDMARTLARCLGAEIELVRYKSPALLADDAGTGRWDVANIGAEPARARAIAFTAAYCEIEATYLVPPDSPITTVEEVDRPGRRIASAIGSAYGLWLDRNITQAEIVQAEGLDGSWETFMAQRCDALAGLRPRLLSDVLRLPGARILPGRFTAVQQAMGTPRDRNPAGIAYLSSFVEAAKASGLVADLITRHQVEGLSVAGPAA